MVLSGNAMTPLHKKSTRVVGIQGLVACLLVVSGSLDVCAQTASTGALTGTVTDPTGAVLQSAQITSRNRGTAETRIAITDQAGSYRFSLLPPGEYELTLSYALSAMATEPEISFHAFGLFFRRRKQ